MIVPHQGLVIERRPKVRSDMHGNGSVLGEIVPRRPGHEYVTLVVGTVRRGEVVTAEDVLVALNRLLDTVRADVESRTPN